MAAAAAILAADMAMSFLWVWSGALTKLLTYRALGTGLHHPHGAEVFKGSLSVLFMFFFAWLGVATRGGAYNPLTVLAAAMTGDFPRFLLTILGRIPSQVVGAIIGVWLIREIFPEVGDGPRLNVDIHHGALTEGLLTFVIVMVSLGLKTKDPKSFFMKTWISSIAKLSLHVLGSDLTGGCMNPASVFGWAYARGDHITKEHLFVYWLAPLEATLLGVWIFSLFVVPHKHKGLQEKEGKKKKKSE